MYSGHFSVTKCSNPLAGYLEIISMEYVSLFMSQSVKIELFQFIKIMCKTPFVIRLLAAHMLATLRT